MRKSLLSAVVLSMMLVPFANAAESPQKPGKWRTTVQMEIAGRTTPPFSSEACVTAEDIKDPQKVVQNDPKNPCKISDYKVDGNTVTWAIDCPKMNSKGTGKITYASDGFAGEMDFKVRDQAMKQILTGKWLGACEK